MITILGKSWWAFSTRNKKFDALGYTKSGGDYNKDAKRAMEVISKYVGEPMPKDIKLIILGTEQ